MHFAYRPCCNSQVATIVVYTYDMNPTNRPLAYAHANGPRFLTELKTFIHLPTISAQPKHTTDVKQCAHWLAAHLLHIGLEQVQVIPTPRHPLVYAEWRHAPVQPTVLIYGHY